MSLFILKIREKFIKSIREGKKTHEYRLATPERRTISVGDILVLKNNQNREDFVKVIVKEKNIFKDWDSALFDSWESDFPDYNSIDDVKKECYKFYTKDDIDKNGIEVLKFSLFEKNVKESNVLLDTNIFIHRESLSNVSFEVMQLYKLMESLHMKKFLHEDIKAELSKHNDKTTKQTMLLKLETYNILESLKVEDSRFIEVVSKYRDDENSVIDNKFLYQIYKEKVDYFITEDKTLIQKAKDLYLDDVVLTCSDFLKLIVKQYPNKINYKVLSVKLTKIASIDINDHFFDSLREDYGEIEFNNWLNKKINEDAYVFKKSNELQGFLYLKTENEDEDYSHIEPSFNKAKRLKVGTFKIISSGLRLGERFIKIIIDNALKNKVDEIYVTLFEGKREEVKTLMNLMMSWGFAKWGYENKRGELVLVKKMKGTYNLKKDPKYNYPLINSKIKYGILPIEAQRHTDLFPDARLKNEDMTMYEERACNYALEKIYVCKQIPYANEPGDILVIYRIAERYPKRYHSVASGYCVVQECIMTESFDEFKKLCSNKSVFTDDQLDNLYNKQGCKVVIKLLYINSFDKKVTYDQMLCNNILSTKPGPRLTAFLNKEQFDKLLEIGMKGN